MYINCEHRIRPRTSSSSGTPTNSWFLESNCSQEREESSFLFIVRSCNDSRLVAPSSGSKHVSSGTLYLKYHTCQHEDHNRKSISKSNHLKSSPAVTLIRSISFLITGTELPPPGAAPNNTFAAKFPPFSSEPLDTLLVAVVSSRQAPKNLRSTDFTKTSFPMTFFNRRPPGRRRCELS